MGEITPKNDQPCGNRNLKWQAEQTSDLRYYSGSHELDFTCRCGRKERAAIRSWESPQVTSDIVTRARTWCRGCGQWWRFEYVDYEWRKGVTFRLIPDGTHWSFVNPPTLESLAQQVAELTERVKVLEEDLRDREAESRGYGE